MSFEFASRRSPVVARSGMVAASQPLAAAAGARILMEGGNAADAAVAAGAVLSVTEPVSTGLGGDCFALFYDARTRQVTALNGSGRAPVALTIDLVRARGLVSSGLRISDPYHALNVTVPGACAGWCDLVARHGTMPLGGVLAPAIRLAEDGFPVAPLTAYFWQSAAEAQLKSTFGGRELTIAGRGPKAGEVFRNPGLARTLRAISQGGKETYYKGEIARAVARAVQASGGVLTEDDLAAHESTWESPIHTTYRGLEVWECPPNGQGIAALIALNILEGYDLAGTSPLSAARLHLLIEAMRVAFADTGWYVADPAFSKDMPLRGLSSKSYAAGRRARIDPGRATLDTVRGAPPVSSDTVYLCAVDGKGNACSFINSNYMGFGTGIVPAGCGFPLQNRGNNFSLDPEHPNALQPGKRPYHTIIPGLMTREQDGSLYAPFGVMGGFMQPQGQVQVAVGLIDDGLDPQAALDRPRFCLTAACPDSQVGIEDGTPRETMAALEQMGHAVVPVTDYAREMFGRGQIICRQPDGVLWGGSDPRADGCAIGF